MTDKQSTVVVSRERFQKWALATEHPVYGWLDGHWLRRGDDREGYADPYVQGLWVAFKAFGAAPVEQQGEPVTWVNDQQLLLCGRSPREDQPNSPMMHNLPRNIAGSALRTDYCNTPLYRHAKPLAKLNQCSEVATVFGGAPNIRLNTPQD